MRYEVYLLIVYYANIKAFVTLADVQNRSKLRCHDYITTFQTKITINIDTITQLCYNINRDFPIIKGGKRLAATQK